MSDEVDTGISRRSFLKGAATVAVGGGLLGGSVGGLLSASEAFATVGPPVAWDEAADLVVVGYGGAGVCAAITARDAGASVIVLEKAPAAEGGNTGVSWGAMHTSIWANDVEEYKQKIKAQSFGETTDDALISASAEASQVTRTWLESHGVPLAWMNQSASKHVPAGKMGFLKMPDGKFGAGSDLFAFLNDLAIARGVSVKFNTPATALVQAQHDSREILGVRATSSGGAVKYYKARKGVILACGGYENNPEMEGWLNYPGMRIYPSGTIYNTGDGQKMATAAGADLWHMHMIEFNYYGYRAASEELGCAVMTPASFKTPHYIFVNKYGKRFANEAKQTFHDQEFKPVTQLDQVNEEFPNVPFWMVFDSAMFVAQPLSPAGNILGTVEGYSRVIKKYKWSDDNSKEVAAGWVLKADTIAELAAKMSGKDSHGSTVTVDAAGLKASIDAFNQMVGAGTADPFGRSASQMGAIGAGPYYAAEMCLTCINTQGGPVHNAHMQTVDVEGQPIPRLYTVGELGSINAIFYVYGNLQECLTTGRVAAEHALTLAPWDKAFPGRTIIEASSDKIHLGQEVTIMGVGKPAVADATVVIMSKEPGKKAFAAVGTAAASSSGAWSYLHKPTKRGIWSYKAKYGNSVSKVVSVSVIK